MKINPDPMTEDQLPVAYQEELQQDIPKPDPVDMDLVFKICDMVPRHTWPAVLDAAVANIVDELPMETMFQMCELYLTDYYLQNPMEIIPDLMRIKGEESALYILDSLQLDKIAASKTKQEEEFSTSDGPCSMELE